MTKPSSGKKMADTVAPAFMLDRRTAVPALIGRHEDFLIVAGLAGTSKDIAALTADGAHIYSMAGAMGGACAMGLGLALARRDKRVLVATGDGELLMNLGTLATIAVLDPPNLSIVVVDNGHYGETGYQKSHTSLGVDLEKIAAGSGIKRTLTIDKEAGHRRGLAPDPRGQRHGVRPAARQRSRAAGLQARLESGIVPHALPYGQRHQVGRSFQHVDVVLGLQEEQPRLRHNRSRPAPEEGPCPLPFAPFSPRSPAKCPASTSPSRSRKPTLRPSRPAWTNMPCWFSATRSSPTSSRWPSRSTSARWRTRAAATSPSPPTFGLPTGMNDVSNLGKDHKPLARDSRQRLFNLGNMLWHSDSSFRAIPAKYSLLSARIVNPKGGDTEFADMRAAYDALDDETKREIEDQVCEHSLMYSRGSLGFLDYTDEEKECSSRCASAWCARTRSRAASRFISPRTPAPSSGCRCRRRASFCATSTSTPPSRASSTCTSGSSTTSSMWDNRQTMHRGRRYDENQPRDVRRTTVAGDAPTVAQQAAE